MTFVFWVVIQFYEDGSTCFVFNEQEPALKRYIKYSGAAILYVLNVGDHPSISEVLRKGEA